MAVKKSGSGGGDGLEMGAAEATKEGRRLGIDEEGSRGGEKEEKLDKNVFSFILLILYYLDHFGPKLNMIYHSLGLTFCCLY